MNGVEICLTKCGTKFTHIILWNLPTTLAVCMTTTTFLQWVLFPSSGGQHVKS